MGKIIGFIPAKGISNRLPKKNKIVFLGKPLISWTLEAAAGSKFLDEIYVSTEDSEIKDISLKAGVRVIDRPLDLCQNDVGKQQVLEHALPRIEKECGSLDKNDIICMLQANSPEITSNKIDEAIGKVVFNREVFECISMNKYTLFTDGAIRVFKKHCLNNIGLGMYLSVVLTDYTDVHFESDLNKIEDSLIV